MKRILAIIFVLVASATIYVGCQRGDETPLAQSDQDYTDGVNALNDTRFHIVRRDLKLQSKAEKWTELEGSARVMTIPLRSEIGIAFKNKGDEHYSSLYVLRSDKAKKGKASNNIITDAWLAYSKTGLVLHGFTDQRKQVIITFDLNSDSAAADRAGKSMAIKNRSSEGFIGWGFIRGYNLKLSDNQLNERQPIGLLGYKKSTSTSPSVFFRDGELCGCPPRQGATGCMCDADGARCVADCGSSGKIPCCRVVGGSLSCNCYSPGEDI